MFRLVRARACFSSRIAKTSHCRDVHLRESACWTVHLALSRSIAIEGIHVHSDFFVNQQASRRNVPEREDAYPENNMFGLLPAYGVYLRHAKDVTMTNIRFDLASCDLRPALLGEDIEDFELNGFRAAGSDVEPLIRLASARSALFRNCGVTGKTGTFLGGRRAA
jgi:hypothetical protein